MKKFDDVLAFDDLDDEAPCVVCAKPKVEHKGTKLYCPMSKRVKPGSRFEAQG